MGLAANDITCVDTRDADKNPLMHRIAPNNKGLSGQNVNNIEPKKTLLYIADKNWADISSIESLIM